MTYFRSQHNKENFYVKISTRLIDHITPPVLKSKDHETQEDSKDKISAVSKWMCVRMMLIHLLRKGDNWKIRLVQVADELGVNEDTVYGWVKLAISAGYLSKTILKNKKNHTIRGGVIYDIYEDGDAPFTEKFIVLDESSERDFIQGKCPDNDVWANPGISGAGFCGTGKPSPYKETSINKNQDTLSKKEISPREVVDKSPPEAIDLPTNPLEKDCSLSQEQLGIPIPASKHVRETAKQENWWQHKCIEELYEAYPNDWAMIDEFTNLHSWMDVYAIHKGLQKSEIRRSINNKIAYIERALLNRRINYLKKRGQL